MPEAEPKFTILHAFSRKNSGDGLLVDLTFELLEQAGVKKQQCDLLALDAESFTDIASVHQAPGEARSVASLRLFPAFAALAGSLLGIGKLHDYLKGRDALIAVGGGYLVADSTVRQIGVSANHLAQLREAARFDGPTIYLPQSIGPLRGPTGMAVRKFLADVDLVLVRDDITMSELQTPNMTRCPDLAVMQLARKFRDLDLAEGSGDNFVLVGRDLPSPGRYVENFRELASNLSPLKIAIQADMDGPRSDKNFYRKLGREADGTLAQVLSDTTGPVISVRLHGAIAALLRGRPAIHLSYERKGWGAYQDLGLAEYVHDARNFDTRLVARQARELKSNPADFWQRISVASDKLERSWNDLAMNIRSRLA